ncbi:precorrin-3B C(17)-methyltransferase [Sneathiella aquimaris]|uniref:precorrin-3B C(17)-methyltransferase n=1 Tax=Sneathiella aquimaris TaxID=2599305 RepID=UPI00146D964A|nr:precorrin-3B C(17)-methyltransferase [Sneathiella aquimaris]
MIHENQKGSVVVAGLGPGRDDWICPSVQKAIDQATDVVGYGPYVSRVPDREGLTLHATDNRVELERARHALEMAASGHRVVVVSSGDPGVFAMASALFEALEEGEPLWRSLDVEILPGVTAMLAAAARLGAPLGHDFCAINLSDNLKPFSLIEKRVSLSVEADFAMAFYNPRSKARPHQFEKILDLLKTQTKGDRLISFARAVSTDEEHIKTVSLSEATPDMADMRTVVIVGSSLTRQIAGTDFVYTPRSTPHMAEVE